jgi:hypothetical protein
LQHAEATAAQAAHANGQAPVTKAARNPERKVEYTPAVAPTAVRVQFVFALMQGRERAEVDHAHNVAEARLAA